MKITSFAAHHRRRRRARDGGGGRANACDCRAVSHGTLAERATCAFSSRPETPHDPSRLDATTAVRRYRRRRRRRARSRGFSAFSFRPFVCIFPLAFRRVPRTAWTIPHRRRDKRRSDSSRSTNDILRHFTLLHTQTCHPIHIIYTQCMFIFIYLFIFMYNIL